MRNGALGRFLAIYSMDVRLTVTHWSYLLLIVVWSGFIIAGYSKPDLVAVKSMFGFVVGFTSLLGLFVAGMQASRVQRSRFHLLEVAFPTGIEVVLARWLATVTTVGGLLVLPTILSMFIPSTAIYPHYFPRIVFVCLLSIAFISGLIWLVQNTIGIRRWMYPLFALVWVGGGFLAGGASGSDLPIPGMGLLNFMIMNEPSDTLWGSLPSGQLPGLFLLFYVGLVVLFLAVMLSRHLVARFYRRSPIWLGLTALSLVVLIAIGVSYTVQVAEANQQVRDDRENIGTTLPEVITPYDTAYTVSAYDLTLTSSEPARLSAAMDVVNRGDTPLTELGFSLHKQFTITDASVPFSRDAHSVKFTLPTPLEPGERTAITLDYEGALWVLFGRYGGAPYAQDFIDPDGVSLSTTTLWYPIPGWIMPNSSSFVGTGEEEEITHGDVTFRMPEGFYIPAGTLDTPTSFHLTVNDAGSLDFASNLQASDANVFESEGTYGVRLIGLDGLRTETEAGITLTTTEASYDMIAPLISDSFPAHLAYLQTIFPDVQAINLHVLERLYYWFNFDAASVDTLFLSLSPRDLSQLVDSPRDEYYDVGQPLIEGLFGAPSQMADSAATFIWAHYITNGNAEEIQQIISGDFPSGAGGGGYYSSLPRSEAVALKLSEIYAAQGQEVTFDLLRQMRAESTILNHMTNDDIVEWIEAQVS